MAAFRTTFPLLLSAPMSAQGPLPKLSYARNSAATPQSAQGKTAGVEHLPASVRDRVAAAGRTEPGSVGGSLAGCASSPAGSAGDPPGAPYWVTPDLRSATLQSMGDKAARAKCPPPPLGAEIAASSSCPSHNLLQKNAFRWPRRRNDSPTFVAPRLRGKVCIRLHCGGGARRG